MQQRSLDHVSLYRCGKKLICFIFYQKFTYDFLFMVDILGDRQLPFSSALRYRRFKWITPSAIHSEHSGLSPHRIILNFLD